MSLRDKFTTNVLCGFMLTGVCYHQQSPQAIVLIWLRSFFRRLCKLLFLLFSSRGVNAETSDPRWCYLASDALTAVTEVTVLLPFPSQLPCLPPLSCLDILNPQGFHCLRVVFFLLTLWRFSLDLFFSLRSLKCYGRFQSSPCVAFIDPISY